MQKTIELNHYFNGQISWENEKMNGFLHGISKGFYLNGLPRCINQFKNGMLYGLSKEYSKDQKEIQLST